MPHLLTNERSCLQIDRYHRIAAYITEVCVCVDDRAEEAVLSRPKLTGKWCKGYALSDSKINMNECGTTDIDLYKK
jgi:hypothetical protein